MPTYLQDNVGISGGSTLIGGTASSEALILVSTSDTNKGAIYIGPTSDTVVIGRPAFLSINSSANMFAGARPKTEIVTGPTSEHGSYEQLMVIRHDGVGSDPVLRRLGLLLKLNTETAGTGIPPDYESNKMGGIVVESSEEWANSPMLSLVTANVSRLTIHANGRTGINTVTDAGYQLDVNGTLRASGLLSANAGLALTVGSDATGDMYYRGSSGQLTRIGIGSTGQVLTVAGGAPVWATGSGGGGGVSIVSASNSEGVTTTVTNSTTTPNIAIGLGNITPTSVYTDLVTAYTSLYIGIDGADARFDPSGLDDDYVYTLPSSDGTLALTNQLPLGNGVLISGDGSTTAFNVTFSTSIPSVTSIIWTPLSAAAMGDYYIGTVSETGFTIHFAIAPPSGTNNVSGFYIVMR